MSFFHNVQKVVANSSLFLFKANKLVSLIGKLVVSIFLVTALTISLSGNLFGQMLDANAQSTTTPEAMLTLEYPIGTLLSSTISKIKSELPNKNLDGINVISISNKLDFEGKTQTFTNANNDSKNSTKFVNSFKKSQNAFLKTLSGFKTADVKRQNYENKEVIQPLVKKYSADTISKTQSKYIKQPTTITGLTISGSLANINKLNDAKKLGASNVNFVDLKAIEQQTKDLQSKLANITDEKQKMEIINQEIAKSLPADAKAKMENSPKLETISQEQIKQIDDVVKKDISGNNFVDVPTIKIKANLTDSQAQEVVKAMNNYNQLPEEIKDGTSQSTQATITTNTAKEIEKNDASTVEKVADFVGNFGGIKASASATAQVP